MPKTVTLCDDCKSLKGKYLVDKKTMDLLLKKRTLELIQNLRKTAATNDPVSFKPNLNLGEGKASERNLNARQDLITPIEDLVFNPMEKVVNSDKSVDDKIESCDGFIQDYITKGQKIVKDNFINSFDTGVDESTTKVKDAAKKQNASYKPNIPKNPDKLQFLIKMAQYNVEDYGLVLRGRLRSAILTEYWMTNKD